MLAHAMCRGEGSLFDDYSPTLRWEFMWYFPTSGYSITLLFPFIFEILFKRKKIFLRYMTVGYESSASPLPPTTWEFWSLFVDKIEHSGTLHSTHASFYKITQFCKAKHCEIDGLNLNLYTHFLLCLFVRIRPTVKQVFKL